MSTPPKGINAKFLALRKNCKYGGGRGIGVRNCQKTKYHIDGLITKLQGGKLRSEYQIKSWLFMGTGLLIQITKSAV